MIGSISTPAFESSCSPFHEVATKKSAYRFGLICNLWIGSVSWKKMHIGSWLPLKTTLSTRRQVDWTDPVRPDTNASDISKGIWYCFVASSRRDARFTWGERYEASTFTLDPIDPSIAHPV